MDMFDLCMAAYKEGTLRICNLPGRNAPVAVAGGVWFPFVEGDLDRYTPTLLYIQSMGGHGPVIERISDVLAEDVHSRFPEELDYLVDAMSGRDVRPVPETCADRVLDKDGFRFRVNGFDVDAAVFGWDGCHKIYVCDSPEGTSTMELYGYDLYPVSELPLAWFLSCPLRFIGHADLSPVDYVPQWEPATFEWDRMGTIPLHGAGEVA